MKKLAPILLLFALTVFFWTSSKHHVKEKKMPKETWISLLNEKKLLQKLSEPLPVWMDQQLSEDFAPFQEKGISKEAVDATFVKIRSTLPNEMLIRYRVVEGKLYRYFPEGESISLRDNTTEKALKTVFHYMDVDNIDFIFSYIDGIPAPGVPEGFYLLENEELQAPILSPAKTGTPPYLILMPDWRSVCHWWAGDITSTLQESSAHPWEAKKDSAFWRGTFTNAIRLKLCQLTNEYPDQIDAKLIMRTNVPELDQIIEKQGLFEERVPFASFFEYRFLPTSDGVCGASPAYQWRLLSNSLTFKEQSDQVQWFYPALKPYVHYIPVEGEYGDLIEKMNWARENEEFCQEVIANSTEFVLSNLMMEDVYRYLYLVFQKYASLQSLDEATLKREVKNDPRWICIQRRRKMRRKVEKISLEGYTLSPTPF